MVAARVLPSMGFQKNAAHPFCCARSRIMSSRLEVVMMIGVAEPAARNRCCSSTPSVTRLQRTSIGCGAASP
jgi:hypothetical protein